MKIYIGVGILLFCLFGKIALGQVYPKSSYTLTEDGTTLIKWLGGDSIIDMMSDPNLSKVKHIGDKAFLFHEKLKHINLSSTVESIGRNSFNGCLSLENVKIPAKISSIGVFSFSHCPNLTSFYVDDANLSFSSLDGVLFNKDLTVLLKYPASKKIGLYIIPSTVIQIQEQAFSRCWFNMSAILIPKNLSSIHDYEFGDCWTMDRIYVDPENTKFISYEGALFDKLSKTLVQYPYGKKEGKFYCTLP